MVEVVIKLVVTTLVQKKLVETGGHLTSGNEIKQIDAQH